MDKIITLEEVAALLRVPVGTLRYWRHQGTGPQGFKVGRHVRYTEGAVSQWLEQQQAAR